MTPLSPIMRRVALAVTLALALPASASAAEKAIWGPATLPNGQSAFPMYAELGVDTYQMQLNWNKVAATRPADPTNPNDPAYRWPAELDVISQQAGSRDIHLALLVNGTPPWANGGRSPIWVPSNVQDYADFLTAAARRYSHIHRWMIWGEPNMAVRFQPQVADSFVSARAYAPLLDAAYGALKKASERNIVIGGMTWTGGDVKPGKFVEQMRLPSGEPPRLDWFGHNPYPFRHPRLRFDPVGDFRDMSDLDTFGREVDRVYRGRDDEPQKLWLSEFQIQSDQRSFAFDRFVSRASQADWLTSAFSIADKEHERVAGIGWFSLIDQPPGPRAAHWGLLTSTLQRKPAYEAYRSAKAKRFSPGVRAASSARRSKMADRGLAVRVTPRSAGRHSVQLRRDGKILTVRRTESERPKTLRLRRKGMRRGNYEIRVVSPRGASVVRPLRVR